MSSTAGIDEVAGGKTLLIMRVTETDAVLVLQNRSVRTWRWRNDGLVFPGRSVTVGCDKDGTIGDATTTLEDLKTSIEFKPPRKGPWWPYIERPDGAGAA